MPPESYNAKPRHNKLDTILSKGDSPPSFRISAIPVAVVGSPTSQSQRRFARGGLPKYSGPPRGGGGFLQETSTRIVPPNTFLSNTRGSFQAAPRLILLNGGQGSPDTKHSASGRSDCMWPRLCTLRERRAHNKHLLSNCYRSTEQSIDMLLPTLNMCDVWFHIPPVEDNTAATITRVHSEPHRSSHGWLTDLTACGRECAPFTSDETTRACCF